MQKNKKKYIAEISLNSSQKLFCAHLIEKFPRIRCHYYIKT